MWDTFLVLILLAMWKALKNFQIIPRKYIGRHISRLWTLWKCSEAVSRYLWRSAFLIDKESWLLAPSLKLVVCFPPVSCFLTVFRITTSQPPILPLNAPSAIHRGLFWGSEDALGGWNESLSLEAEKQVLEIRGLVLLFLMALLYSFQVRFYIL